MSPLITFLNRDAPTFLFSFWGHFNDSVVKLYHKPWQINFMSI